MSNAADDVLLKASDLRRRWNCSDQLLHRRRRDDPTFPQPVHLGESPHRYWRLSDVMAYEEMHQEGRAA